MSSTELTSAELALPRHPAQQRHGRRALLRIACFFALVSALALVLDGFIDFGLRQVRTGDVGVDLSTDDAVPLADVIVSGSSRAMSHYDPRVLSSSIGTTVYNIGLNGSQTDMQVARLKTYLAHNTPPRLLIHNLDAFSFQVSHGGVYDPGQYVPYLGEPALYDALLHIDADTRKSRYLPLYGYAVQDLRLGWLQGLRHWLSPPRMPTHFDGYKPRDSAWTGEFERFRDSNPGGVKIDIEDAGIRQMVELLRLCQERGIKVVLVYSPEYREMQLFTTNRADIFRRFEMLSRQFGVPLIDFSNSLISADARAFYNSQHLNTSGATAFSHELAERLKAKQLVLALKQGS
jgi:hypothetical protein